MSDIYRSTSGPRPHGTVRQPLFQHLPWCLCHYPWQVRICGHRLRRDRVWSLVGHGFTARCGGSTIL